MIPDFLYPNMNQGGPDMYYQHSMSAGPPPPQQSGQPHYGHQQQPPLLHPGPSQYPPPHYNHNYGYANGLTSPPGPPQGVSGPMGPGANVLPLPNPQQGMQANQYQAGFDTTGQVAPPGMKPRVTATLWEDEGSLCFQVEARGICVARREDNHMINGTKLLNVAGMTRGRRDGILKSEKLRHVVKIGPMHLKGVWIPFERALDFANKEKITELLYPLFVHNIGSLLYHPTNSNRTSQVMAVAAEQRRKQDQAQMRGGQPGGPGLPALQQHHHHSIPLPPPQLSSHQHPSMGRPSMERAHTFPTPPTSASSLIGGVGASDSFQWGQQGMSNGQGPNPISIDTGLSNGSIPDSHSNRGPNTPATTPPGSSVQNMHNYPPVSQPYDNSRQMYQGSQPQQPPYQPSNPPPQDRPLYGQSPYVKSEMGPPSSRPGGAGSDQADSKPPNGMMHPAQSENGSQHQATEDEGDHEHETEYTHDGGAYDANRGPYNYSVPPSAPISSDHAHIAPDISGSPHQGASSGRATPRSAAPQAYYSQGGYHTPPPRPGQSSSTLYSVISNDRGPSSGASASDVYAGQPEMNGSLQNGYAPPPVMNGGSSGLKRGRDDDDDRPTSGGNGMPLDAKRRKMLESPAGPTPSPTYNIHGSAMPQSAPVVAPQRRR